jgi:hypothetical protein
MKTKHNSCLNLTSRGIEKYRTSLEPYVIWPLGVEFIFGASELLTKLKIILVTPFIIH